MGERIRIVGVEVNEESALRCTKKEEERESKEPSS
jgi:hypothetical protein